jgi:hypothetical protein
MPLDSYSAARPFALQVAQATTSRIMPPWLPSDGTCMALKDARTITQDQITILSEWAMAAAPEGNMADYLAPPPPVQTLPPTGNIVAQPDAPYTPTIRVETDDYHCFVMDPHLTTQQDVIGMRITPGNGAIVHHVILYEVRQAALAQLSALDHADPGAGYTCFGSAGVNPNFRRPPQGSADLAELDSQMIAGWAPGSVPSYFPEGTGVRLKPGSLLVMQVHYNLASKSVRGMSDRTRVDLYTAQSPVASQALLLPVAQTNFTVPAGTPPTDPAATVTAALPSPAPLRVFGVAPHMHLRGREISVSLAHSDGTSACMIHIPNWDFHWQQVYWFQTPTRLRAGDSLGVACVYDNTAANQPTVDGVQQPPHDLHWGESTYDEMCVNFFYVAL